MIMLGRVEDVGIDRSPNTGFLENCPGSRWSRSQLFLAATFGTKLVARRFQERSSYHNVISGADFAAQPYYVAIVETLSEQQLVDCNTADSACNDEFMNNSFAFCRDEWHVHGGQLQLHRNKGDLHFSESQRRTRPVKCHGKQGHVL